MMQKRVLYLACLLIALSSIKLVEQLLKSFINILSATKAPVVTTGSGYTILPPENKTESIPKVQPEGSSGIIAVITSVIVAVILIALFIVSIEKIHYHPELRYILN